VEKFRFNRVEFAGALGDLGTLIPLAVGLIVINNLSPSAVFLMVGVFYILAGLYFRLPVPVQPLKVVSAIAIAMGSEITPQIIAASAYLFGAVLILIAITGVIDALARLFKKPIVRGIQLGLGLILILKACVLLDRGDLFLTPGEPLPRFLTSVELSLNLLLGMAFFILALILINSKRYPSALVVVMGGILIGLTLKPVEISLGATEISMVIPSQEEFAKALFLLVIPQLPLTIGNAIISTRDTAISLFGKEKARRVTNRALSMSMGLVNLVVGVIGGMPMCHGAGGLAAHFRFGARTGGSNLMIGSLFIILALAFGKASVGLLLSIPASVLGVLLFFAGVELALLIRDLKQKSELFVALVVAGVSLSTVNMGYAFLCGIVLYYLMEKLRIEL